MVSLLLVGWSERLPILTEDLCRVASTFSLKDWLAALRTLRPEEIAGLDGNHPLYKVTEKLCGHAPDTASGINDALNPDTPHWLRAVMVKTIFPRAEGKTPKDQSWWNLGKWWK